ncbi:hypothetical protein V2J09_021321 [Rumex salicifolius]
MSIQVSLLISPGFKRPLSLPSLQQSIPPREKEIGCGLRCLKCNATPNRGTQQGRTHEIENKKGTFEQHKDVFQSDNLPQIKWSHHEHAQNDSVDDDFEVTPDHLKVDEINERADTIKSMLRSMDDGEITVSPYDTAWVALVKDKNGNPEFPTSLKWIANNQLEDGSWGDEQIFAPHDRILNTLACVIALTTWTIHPHKCRKGMEFIRENLGKIGGEDDEHMPIGFEVVFPSLIEIARGLGIQLHDDSGVLQHIYAQRNIKLQRIPKEILHNKPTSLLHSLEGMQGLEWEKLMKLQSKDGSFLFSPASTAFALIQTKDLNCARYLDNVVSKFNGGDLFERIWVVDRLQRLGISRLFKDEIKECMEYVHKYWSEDGICWARNSEVQDIDDTAMGFRLLRLHGYNVSSVVIVSSKLYNVKYGRITGVFENFKKNGEFFCFVGQSTQAVTGMYNLFRASQLQFPDEEILEEAKHYSYNYLTQKKACNQLLDKWIIMKDLPGEVDYALNLPWYANLPRIETRFYIEQYGGGDDVWIGKTLYRMPYVNNSTYLELAKLDFKTIQSLHLLEWDSIKRWYVHNNLKKYGLSQSKLLQVYFVAAASIFEPKRSYERLGWAKSAALVEAIESHCRTHKDPSMARRVFVHEKGLVGAVKSTLGKLTVDVFVEHGVDIGDNLRQAWEKWMVSWVEAGVDIRYTGEAELLTRTIQACNATKFIADEEEYHQLMAITNKICKQLIGHVHPEKHYTTLDVKVGSGVNEDMQRLAEMVFIKKGKGKMLDAKMKLSFWDVARSYYYTAYCSPTTINSHLLKVMFQTVA